MEQKWQDLRNRLQTIADLQGINSLLGWDQKTYMPPGGAAARGRQMATVQRLVQQRQTDPALGRLLDELEAGAANLPADSDDAALLRVARRDFDRASRVPADFVARRAAHSAQSFAAWTQARPAHDFQRMVPFLEQTLALSQEFASFFPYQRIMDPIIDYADQGLTTDTVAALFAELRQGLVPMVRAITSQPAPDTSCRQGDYPGEKQLAFARQVITAFGYDYERGRDDPTHHPFATSFSLGDVRITTRTSDSYLGDGLFATFHEAGHAMYEQGSKPAYEGTPLAGGTSSGVHESQSRLWENLVGRSRPFWEHYYPQLVDTFPGPLGGISLDTFYRAINAVAATPIRVSADELTYNLHIMLRFELALDMMEGRLAVADLRDAWNGKYESYLGITPPHDGDGVLQDLHWYTFAIGGMFQGYTLGNVLSAQFYSAAMAAHPTIEAEIGRGEFGTLYGWLAENVYAPGSKYTPLELLARIGSDGIDTAPYFSYLRRKYGELYDL